MNPKKQAFWETLAVVIGILLAGVVIFWVLLG